MATNAKTGEAGVGHVASPVAAIERELMLLARALEAVQRKRSYPLERSELIILRTLAGEGGGAVGSLARTLLLDDSTMTRQIAALEQKGLVERVPDPADRRAGLITVTEAGEVALQATLALRLARVERYLDGWSAEDQEAFGRLLARFNATLFEGLRD